MKVTALKALRPVGIIWLLGLVALLLVVLACQRTETRPTATETPGSLTAPTGAGSLTTGVSPLYVGSILAGSGQATGVWVTGTGTLKLQPDMAVVSLGVEAKAKTVAEARDMAAAAMRKVIDSLKAKGIADKDIQTRHFSIQPEYQWREVIREQVLVGYVVTNQITASVRNLQGVPSVVDDAAIAGGDLIRISGVSFTVENPKPFQTKARETAVLDALDKARQFAQLTGITLGKLLYITESGGGIPVVQTRAWEAAALTLKVAEPTPISPGELEIMVQVQAVFAIQ
ncbi:MAG: SIMPL domain-containing protein [Chloroflexi bacterium]|nr:SIMPL domain-containing protein [Chloroflexota bacterium]